MRAFVENDARSRHGEAREGLHKRTSLQEFTVSLYRQDFMIHHCIFLARRFKSALLQQLATRAIAGIAGNFCTCVKVHVA